VASKRESQRIIDIKKMFSERTPDDCIGLFASCLEILTTSELKFLHNFFIKNKKYLLFTGKKHLDNPGYLSRFILSCSDEFNYVNIIYWAQLIIENNNQILTNFIVQKKEYENCFLLADYSTCFTILRDIEHELGLSWWLIESKIELLSKAKGAKEKATYINELMSSVNNQRQKNASAFNFIIEKISKRNDDKTQLKSFNKQVENILNTTGLPSYVLDNIRFRLFKAPNPNSEPYNLIDSCCNIVDLFETFNHHIIRNFKGVEFSEPQLDKSIKHIYKKLKYHIYANYLLSIDNLKQKKYYKNFTPSNASIAFLKGNLVGAKNYALNEIKNSPACPETLHILTSVGGISDLDSSLLLKDSPILELLNNLSKARTFEDDSDSVVSELQRFICNNFSLNVSYFLESMLNESSNLCDTQITKINNRFITSYEQDIFTLPILESFNDFSTHDSLENSKIRSIIAAKSQRNPALIDELTLPLIQQSINNNNHNSVFIINERCLCLLEQEKYFECIQLCVDSILLKKSLINILPINELIHKRRWKFFKGFKEYIETSIIIHLYLTLYEDSLQSTNLGFAWNWYRKSQGLLDIAELPTQKLTKIQKKKVICLLSDVTSPQVLEHHSDGLNTQEEVLTARADVIKKLIEIDPTKATIYEKERLSILKNISIQRGLDNLNQNKIYVDTNIIRSWAYRELQVPYEQYQETLQNPEIAISNNDSMSLLIQTLIKEIINPPEEQVLYSMLSSEYLNNKQGGLNFFLSMRIRHGKFEGTLRKPLSDNHLLTTKDEEGEYQSNDYWQESISLDDSINEELLSRLKKLSMTFDEIINTYLNSKLRCYSDKYPHGRFYTKLTMDFRENLKSKITNGMSFEEFLDSVIAMLKSDVELCLESIKSSIDFDISKVIQKQLNQILEFAENKNIPKIADKVKSTLGQFQNTCNTVKNWFNFDEIDIAKESLSIDDCFEISQASINDVYSSSHSMDLRVIREIDCNIKLSDLDSNYLNEALYIMYENIYKRSNLKENIKVKVRISIDELGRLKLVMLNMISKGTCNNKNKRKVQKIRNILHSGDYLNHANNEGNSGILKLRNLNPTDDNACLRFALRKSAFFIDFRLHLNSTKMSEI
jgi:hypothetical protein